MWYLAELMFAEPPQADRDECQCESSNVVLQADDARAAYVRARALGESRESEPGSTMRFLGVAHLTTIGDRLEDGTEVSGNYFSEPSVWARIPELIPDPEALAAIAWESNQDVPLADLLTPSQVATLKRVL